MDQISRGRLHWRSAPVSCHCPAKSCVAEELFLDVSDALMAYAPLNANHRQYKDQGNRAGCPPEPKQSVIAMECTPVGPRLLKTGSLDGSKINKTGAILRIPLMFLRPPEP